MWNNHIMEILLYYSISFLELQLLKKLSRTHHRTIFSINVKFARISSETFISMSKVNCIALSRKLNMLLTEIDCSNSDNNLWYKQWRNIWYFKEISVPVSVISMLDIYIPIYISNTAPTLVLLIPKRKFSYFKTDNQLIHFLS